MKIDELEERLYDDHPEWDDLPDVGRGRQGLLNIYKLVKEDKINFGQFKRLIQAHRGIIH